MIELGWFGLVFCFMDLFKCLWWKWMGKMPRSQKQRMSLLHSIQILIHFLMFSNGLNRASHWKGYTVTPLIFMIHPFLRHVLSNLYIKRNVSQELKLLGSKNIAFVHTLSFFLYIFFFCHFFSQSFVPLFSLTSNITSLSLSHILSVCSLKTMKMEYRCTGLLI